MEAITNILQLIGIATGAIHGSVTVANLLARQLREWARSQPTARVMEFLHDLGLRSESDVQEAVENWIAPAGFTEANKQELIALLLNLVRGARLHSTNGTPLSSYLRCERLIEQLIQNIQPCWKAGESVGGWRLDRFLGMGSFGEVWLARKNLITNRVIKFITQDGARNWLRREAEVLYSITTQLRQCPNIIDYLDVEIDAEPYPYLMLEYVAGGSLEDWILRRPDDRIPLNLTELMLGIVRGMAAAHRHNIHHRDLKPANILLTDEQEPIPKIADFGLSSVDTPIESQSSLRSEMVLVGTRMYHPPEASDPFRSRRPAQDDVFALGVIWYQILTGELLRPPYDFAERLRTSGADSRSIKLISRCLAHPDRRYPSACELYEELDIDTPPGPGEWAVPEGCFDVAGIAREYLERTRR